MIRGISHSGFPRIPISRANFRRLHHLRGDLFAWFITSVATFGHGVAIFSEACTATLKRKLGFLAPIGLHPNKMSASPRRVWKAFDPRPFGNA